MKKEKLMVIAVAVIAVSFLLQPLCPRAYAYTDEEKFEARREKKFEETTKELGLSQAQKEALQKQRAKFSARRKEGREKILAAHESLRQELEKPVIDRASVDRLVAELQNLIGQQIRSRVDGVIEAKKILTPEQFKKLQEKMRLKQESFRYKRNFFKR